MTERYFGYVLPKDGGRFDGARFEPRLAPKIYREFEEFIAVTVDLRPFVIDYMGLEANFLAFDKIPTAVTAKYETMENPLTDGALGQVVQFWNTQNALSNFLFSTSSFRDRSLTRLRERYGESSHQYVEFDAAITNAYESSIEYRLFYNLRNYAQHHDIPISHIPVSATRHPETNKVEATTRIVIKPEILAGSSLIQKSFAQKDLAGMTGDIDLSVFAKVYMRLHSDLMKKIIDMQGQRLIDMHHYEAAVMNRLKMPAGAIPVIWEGDMPMSKGEAGNAKFTYFSFDELNLIRFLYDRLVAQTG